jgi:beta-1,4-mannosyl-glycoprotein beta-1,4-N-acetylglucosaminyltransferase
MISKAQLQSPSIKCRARRVDACIFYNEIDLLMVRLEELWDCVDYFVVVEADETFSGQSKPLFFLEHQAQFKPYADKLIYRSVVDLPPILSQSEEARFLREHAQRNAITSAVSELNLSSSDIVIVSDADEIPRAFLVDSLDDLLIAHEYLIFIQTNYRGYINNTSDLALNGAKWAGTVACRVGTLLREGAQQVRRGNNKSGGVVRKRSPDYRYIDDGGWHFSSFGGPEAFWLKAANFAHIDDPHRVIRLGEKIPGQQVFSAALSREQCRALQRQYLDHCVAPHFSSLGFDTFVVSQDIPAFIRREKERFRGYFFFTDLVELRSPASALEKRMQRIKSLLGLTLARQIKRFIRLLGRGAS